MFPNDTKILIVDDIKGVRVLIRKLLNQLGYNDIVEAEHGAAAWKLVQSDNFGLIICDLMMPEMNGLELLKTVRMSEKHKGLPFMMLTAESEKEKIMEAIEIGVNEYVIKPTTALILKQKMERAWDQRLKIGA